MNTTPIIRALVREAQARPSKPVVALMPVIPVCPVCRYTMCWMGRGQDARCFFCQETRKVPRYLEIR